MVIELKADKERKIMKGIIIECIAKDCKQKAVSSGFCWEHLDIYNKENEE